MFATHLHGGLVVVRHVHKQGMGADGAHDGIAERAEGADGAAAVPVHETAELLAVRGSHGLADQGADAQLVHKHVVSALAVDESEYGAEM